MKVTDHQSHPLRGAFDKSRCGRDRSVPLTPGLVIDFVGLKEILTQLFSQICKNCTLYMFVLVRPVL